MARRNPAQWVTGRGKAPRFYWYGTWTSYAPDGQTIGIQNYTNGILTRAETYAGGQLTLAENYVGNSLTRAETYRDGRLTQVDTYENNWVIRTINTL